MDDQTPHPPRWEHVSTPEVDWVIDAAFLGSNWTCIWGAGCLGIDDEPAEALQRGCCSVGAHIDGPDEARTVAALASMLDPAIFEHHARAAADGIFTDAEATNTAVVDGACIFLNRPGFAGGAGCALHLGAVADGERPQDWKPSVCWQLPVHVDWEDLGGGREQATVRGWSRADWGTEGETMAWCCTEGERAYVGAEPVVVSLASELEAVLGRDVLVEITKRLDAG